MNTFEYGTMICGSQSLGTLDSSLADFYGSTVCGKTMPKRMINQVIA